MESGRQQELLRPTVVDVLDAIKDEHESKDANKTHVGPKPNRYGHVESRLYHVPRRLRHVSQREPLAKGEETRRRRERRGEIKEKRKEEKGHKWNRRRSYLEARRRRQQYRERLIELILHRDPWDDESVEIAQSTDAPLTTREKDTLRYYYYIHKGIADRLVAPLSHSWFRRILSLVSRSCRDKKMVDKVRKEVEQDYLFAVKKSIVDFVLNEPEIEEDERFLDDNDETEMTIELAKVSDAWRKQYKISSHNLKCNLHNFAPSIQSAKRLWQEQFQHLTLIQLDRFEKSVELSSFQDSVYEDVEKVQQILTQQWLPRLFEIIRNENGKNAKNSLEKVKFEVNSLRCLAAQSGIFVQHLCLQSMRDFARWISTMDSSKNEICDIGFVLTLKSSGSGTVKLVPSLLEIENMAMDVFDLMLRVVNNIPRIETLLEVDSDLKIRPDIPMEEVEILKKSVLNTIKKESKFPMEYMKVFQPFLCLINGQAEQEVCEFLEKMDAQPNFEALMAKIMNLRDLITDLKATFAPDAPNSQSICKSQMFVLQKDDLIASLLRRAQSLKERVVQRLSAEHQNCNRALCARFEEMSNIALTSPKSTTELVSLREKAVILREEVDGKMANSLIEAAKRIGWLADFLQFTTADVKLNIKTFQWHSRMSGVFDENAIILRDKAKLFQQKLREKQAKFAEELDTVNGMVDDFYNLSDLDDLPKYSERLHSLEQRLTSCRDKMAQFESEELAFDWEITSYPVFDETIRRLTPFLRIHGAASGFMGAQQLWLKSHMGSHEPEAIEREVEAMWDEVTLLEREFENSQISQIDLPEAFRNVVLQIKERMQNFLQRMPLIRTLGNPGLRERHWEQISHTVGFPVNPESTLAQILDMGLDESVAKFAKISNAASMEYKLEIGLKNMDQAWDKVELHLTPYPNSNTFTFLDMDQVHTLLDDHLVQLQTMKGSLHVAFFEAQIASSERRLTTLNEILDAWLAVQGDWQRLEPLFSSAEIVAQMPEEGRRFATVDKTWRDLMKAAVPISKEVLKVLEIDRILEKLRKSTELLLLIARGLKQFLEKKRKVFPRCYFLSDNAMLAMMAETKIPQNVQKHLPRCFEGIKALEFDKNNFVTSIIGADNERVKLIVPVDTNSAKGQVDQWLINLETQLRLTIKRQIADLYTNEDNYPNYHNNDSSDAYCEQAKTVVIWLRFRAELDNALLKEDSSSQLKALLMKTNNRLNDLIEYQNPSHEMSVTKVLALKNLILAQGFMQDTLQQLTFAKDAFEREFIWHCKLKYELSEDNNVNLNIGDTSIPYGYEYLDVQPRLVLSAETQRTISLLALAYTKSKVGLVTGASAAGKTRTIQELSRAAGKLCVIFNCARDLGARAFLKFVKGVVGCGAWVCFDQLHCVKRQVLSVVAGHIMRLEQIVAKNVQKSIEFDDKTCLEVRVGGAIFATGEANMTMTNISALPTMQVAMALPDAAIIAEMELRASGFKFANILAPKLASMADLCDGLLSSQPHYELSLHAVLAVVRAATRLKNEDNHGNSENKNNGSDNEDDKSLEQREHSLLSRALHSVKLSELLPQDQSMFRRVLKHLFEMCPHDSLPDDELNRALKRACTELFLQPNDELLSKVQQLKDMMSNEQTGVMLLGEPFGAKTTAWRLLARALQQVRNSNIDIVVVNPKAITLAELFGTGDEDDHEGDEGVRRDDGILARTLRQFDAANKEEEAHGATDDNEDKERYNEDKESNKNVDKRKKKNERISRMHWIIFDGPVDPEWIENLNTMLDESRQLCLMSGEMVRLPLNTHVIFEARNLEQATPATISRCGVLYMDAAKLPWQHLIIGWATRAKIEGRINENLIILYENLAMEQLLPRMLDFLRKNRSDLCQISVVSDHQMVVSLLNLLQALLTMPQHKESDKNAKEENNKSMAEMSKDELDELTCRQLAEASFLFALIWSIGAICHEQGKSLFEAELRRLHGQMSDQGKLLFDLPPENHEKTVFDYRIHCQIGARQELEVSWVNWQVSAEASLLSRDLSPNQLIVVHPQMVRMQYVLSLLLQQGSPVLLSGPAGSGKSVLLKDLLQNERFIDKDLFREVVVALTAVTNARHVRMAITERLEKRRKGVLGPPLGKRLTVLIDHVDAPEPDEGGAQSCLELVRMALNNDAWYYPEQNACLKLVDTSFVSTTSNAALLHCSTRVLRHFSVLHLDGITGKNCMSIFGRILLWHLDLKGFGKEFDACIHQVVSASLQLHSEVMRHLKVTLRHPHYVFSLKDVANLIFGVLLSTPETMSEGLVSMKKLWVHEATRIYADKLNDESHFAIFTELLRQATKEHLDADLNSEILGLEQNDSKEKDRAWSALSSLLYADFVPDALGPSQNDSHDADSAISDSLSKLYREVLNKDRLRKEAEIRLQQLNAKSKRSMDLVLFDSALKHLCRLVRWLKQPQSNIILAGLGGSGRQSIVRLAAHIADQSFSCFNLESDPKSFSSHPVSSQLDSFRKRLSDLVLKMSTEQSTKRHHVLFIYAAQPSAQIWQDLNNLVCTGNIPELFSNEMETNVLENVQKWLGDASTQQKKADLLRDLAQYVKEHLHLVLAFDPFSGALGQVMKQFPALKTECVVYWMPQWRHEDLAFITKAIWEENGEEHFEHENSREILKKLAQLSRFCHETTIKLASNLHSKDNHTRILVTPASYLEMTRLCVTLNVRQSAKLIDLRQTLESSLETLRKTQNHELSSMQIELDSLQPKLEDLSKNLEQLQAQLEIGQANKAENEKIVREKESNLREKRDFLEQLMKKRDNEFEEAHKQMDHARALLAELAPQEISQMSRILAKNANLALKLALEAVYITIKPLSATKNAIQALESTISSNKVNKHNDVLDGLWQNARVMVSELDFLPNIIHFSRQNVSNRVAQIVRDRFLSHPDLNNRSNLSNLQEHLLRGLVTWLKAIDVFDQVTKNTESQSEQLEVVERECQVAGMEVQERQKTLEQSQQRLLALNEEVAKEMRSKSEIEALQDALTRKLERAQQIVATFDLEHSNNDCQQRDEENNERHKTNDEDNKNEGKSGNNDDESTTNVVSRWQNRLKETCSSIKCLKTDLLLASATIAYLGPFDHENRENQIHLWHKEALRLKLAVSKDYDLIKALSLPLEHEDAQIFLENCQNHQLPKDKIARENAIMMALTLRWPMMADPHSIAKNWTRSQPILSQNSNEDQLWPVNKSKNLLKILKQTDSEFMSGLETAIQLGQQVLIENVADNLKADLEPLLQKHTFMRGDTRCLRLNETTLEYNESFSLLLATRTSKPLFEAEILSTINIINFELSRDGMLEHFLELIVLRERPELSEEISQMEKQMSEICTNLRKIDMRMRTLLAAGHRALLEDETSVKEMLANQSNFIEIVDKLAITKKAKGRLENAKNQYKPLAKFLVTLFENCLNKLADLNAFYCFSLNWLTSILALAVENAEKSDEIAQRIESIKNLVLEQVLRTLARAIKQEDLVVVDIVMAVQMDQLSSKEVSGLAELATRPILDLTEKSERSEVADLAYQLESLLDNKSTSYRLKDRLGTSRVLNSELVSTTSPQTPILLMLDESQGTNDVCREIEALAEEKNLKRIEIVTLASNEPCKRAKNLLNEMSSSNPGWLILIHCELVKHFVESELEPICYQLEGDNELLHPDFRLWILVTLDEKSTLPTSLIKQSTKIVLEQPSELKSNINFFMTKYEAVAKDVVALGLQRKLLLFHALVNHRRSLSQCGWKHEYVFDLSKLDTCHKFVRSEKKALINSDKVAEQRLRFLVTTCIYGGAMLDEADRTLLESIFDHVFRLRDEEVDQLLKVADEFEDNEALKVSSAVIEHRRVKSQKKLQQRLLRVLPKIVENFEISSNTSSNNDDWLWSSNESCKAELVANLDRILNDLPNDFELRDSAQCLDEGQSILGLVLRQELQKYNLLFQQMRVSIEQSKHMLAGKLAYSAHLASLIKSVEQDELPELWLDRVYPTLENLQNFMLDLRKRVQFLQNWQNKGASWPKNGFWLAPFFEPGDLIIALTYIASVRAEKPYHALSIVCQPLLKENDFEDFNDYEDDNESSLVVEGLFLVGGIWRNNRVQRGETLYCSMPPLKLSFVDEKSHDETSRDETNHDETSCDETSHDEVSLSRFAVNVGLYQTSDRRGEDNFICELSLPTNEEGLELSGLALLCQRPRG